MNYSYNMNFKFATSDVFNKIKNLMKKYRNFTKSLFGYKNENNHEKRNRQKPVAINLDFYQLIFMRLLKSRYQHLDCRIYGTYSPKILTLENKFFYKQYKR